MTAELKALFRVLQIEVLQKRRELNIHQIPKSAGYWY